MAESIDQADLRAPVCPKTAVFAARRYADGADYNVTGADEEVEEGHAPISSER
jgi:hypothetical protein